MTIGKSILGLFVEVTEDPAKPTNNAQTTVASKPASNTPPTLTPEAKIFNPTPSVQPASTETLSPDEQAKFAMHFAKVFDDANLPGADYYEYTKMLDAMSTLSDEVKIPSVYAAMNAQGADKAKLLKTAQQYKDIISAEAQKLSGVLDAEVLGKINKRKEDLDKERASIKEKEELIAKLTLEIQSARTSIDNESIDIAASEQKFKNKLSAFNAAVNAVQQHIDTDVEKINKYIQ